MMYVDRSENSQDLKSIRWINLYSMKMAIERVAAAIFFFIIISYLSWQNKSEWINIFKDIYVTFTTAYPYPVSNNIR